MKWAVTWFNDTKIILDSHDAGSYGWTIDTNGELKAMNKIDRDMENEGKEAFKIKYGSHGLQH